LVRYKVSTESTNRLSKMATRTKSGKRRKNAREKRRRTRVETPPEARRGKKVPHTATWASNGKA
jgi:hypothetical protein